MEYVSKLDKLLNMLKIFKINCLSFRYSFITVSAKRKVLCLFEILKVFNKHPIVLQSVGLLWHNSVGLNITLFMK